MSGYTIYCHPENLAWLKRETGAGGTRDLMLDLPIVASPLIPRRRIRQEWRPPVWPFCTIEPSDHEWLRNLGFGSIVEIDEGPLFLRLRNYEFATPLPLVNLSIQQ